MFSMSCARSAPQSSRLGKEILFYGATCDFDAIRLTVTCSESTVLRYAQAPNANSDASENSCNSVLVDDPLQVICLRMLSCAVHLRDW